MHSLFPGTAVHVILGVAGGSVDLALHPKLTSYLHILHALVEFIITYRF